MPPAKVLGRGVGGTGKPGSPSRAAKREWHELGWKSIRSKVVQRYGSFSNPGQVLSPSTHQTLF